MAEYCVRIVVTGRVQGVGYRAWTVATAKAHKVYGWVRNRSDGTVEAVLHGTHEDVAEMLEACKRGPSSANVMKMESFTCNEEVEARAFFSRPTI